MKKPRVHRHRFPALEAFFLGYLHQDLAVVHGSVDGAMDAFISEADTDDLHRLANEWRALESLLVERSVSERFEALRRLGCTWLPEAWVDVEAVFARLDVDAESAD